MHRQSVLAAVVLAWSITSVQASIVGTTWDRSADWTGTSANPQNVWTYQVLPFGGDIYNANPWWMENTTNMGWDSAHTRFKYTPSPADTPYIDADRLRHNGHDTYAPYRQAPTVRWTNISTESFVLQITGEIVFEWANLFTNNGWSGKSIDAAIVYVNSANATRTELWSQRSTKSGNWNVETKTVSLPTLTQWVNPGDSILITLQGVNWTDSSYTAAIRDQLTLTAIPEPASLGLLGVSVLGLGLRRRRNV